MLKLIMLFVGLSLVSTGAIAQSGEPLAVKNLQYVTGKVDRPEVVILPADQAPADIKIGNKYYLVDIDDDKVTGTGTVSNTGREGNNNGPITIWLITVDTVEK